ncbi:hypothetical protein BHE74_00019915 [Ensete ventricosum]|nr:hypothetical protein BHE74_00019915 [Ensete ventricosum]
MSWSCGSLIFAGFKLLQGRVWERRSWGCISTALFFTYETTDGPFRGQDGVDNAVRLGATQFDRRKTGQGTMQRPLSKRTSTMACARSYVSEASSRACFVERASQGHLQAGDPLRRGPLHLCNRHALTPSVLDHGKFLCLCRFEYRTGAATVTRKLYDILTAIQMGQAEDKKRWTLEI